MASASESIRATFDDLEAAWARGDGAAFAAKCTPDVDFINLLGMYAKGREAVTAMHEKIFNGPYAGSTLQFSIEHVRQLSDDMLLVITPGELQIPSGPVQGIVRTVATILLVRNGPNWEVASFHNTKREATQAGHTAVMLETFRSDAPQGSRANA